MSFDSILMFVLIAGVGVGLAGIAFVYISIWMYANYLDRQADAEYESERMIDNAGRNSPTCMASKHGSKMICSPCGVSWDVSNHLLNSCRMDKS